jgi:hypothetical protein
MPRPNAGLASIRSRVGRGCRSKCMAFRPGIESTPESRIPQPAAHEMIDRRAEGQVSRRDCVVIRNRMGRVRCRSTFCHWQSWPRSTRYAARFTTRSRPAQAIGFIASTECRCPRSSRSDEAEPAPCRAGCARIGWRSGSGEFAGGQPRPQKDGVSSKNLNPSPEARSPVSNRGTDFGCSFADASDIVGHLANFI